MSQTPAKIGVPGNDAASWHCLEADATAARLRTDRETGLEPDEALKRAAQFGPNRLREASRQNPFRLLARQFTDFMILVLVAAALVAGYVGDPEDAIAIVVIVLLNGIIGFIQEFRAERAMAALRQLSSPVARVIRGGQPCVIDASELVPGDLIELEAGNVVPADLRLVAQAALQIDESLLTGESQPVAKCIESLPDAELPMADQRNLAFRGSVVTTGRGRGVVIATGMATRIGHIAGMLATASSRTPLQERLARFGRALALAVLGICTVIFLVGWLRGEPPLLMLLTAISLAVAAIPEALPAVVTISLALGAARMARMNALVRRLPAVETLGSVTWICSDKTGTLTENRMRVDCLMAADGRTIAPGSDSAAPWPALARAMALCNDATRDPAGELQGDPTETALLRAAEDMGLDRQDLLESLPRRGELAFDSARARMSTLHPDGERLLVLVKGAPERIIPRCHEVLTAAGLEPADHARLQAQAEALAAQGLRVLAFAQRHITPDVAAADPDQCEEHLVFLGLAGLIDPPRASAAAAVAACRAAGIVPVMITGDHPATARAIATRLGIASPTTRLLTGRDLARLDDTRLAERIGSVRVYARVDPEQKIRIVQALQARGEYVAMTGDGVNDAPALRRADIGIAMGQGGTDVAREASHMTLLDNDFATIVAAIREGRRIFDNVRKFVRYTMTSNAGEIWTIFLAPLLGLPIPLLPIHILWINLVTDGLPGLALAREPDERGIMERPPRPPRESIFAHGLWQHVIWVGLLLGGVCLATQAWAWHTGAAHWQTMTFTVLTLSQLGHALAIRFERASLFGRGLASNPWLLGAIVGTVALQLAVIYLPACNAIFRTQPLSIDELLLCLGLSTIVFWAVEIEKALVRRGWLYQDRAQAPRIA